MKSRAKFTAADRHAANNALVKKRIKEVDTLVERGIKYTRTGKYSKKRSHDDIAVNFENPVSSERNSPPPPAAGLPRQPAAEEDQQVHG
mgnify:CR=1 FL=1